MKIRKGFVSNSSSCSFIVKITDSSFEDFKTETICPCCGSKTTSVRNSVFNYIDSFIGFNSNDEKTTNLINEDEVEDYKDRDDLNELFLIGVSNHNTDRIDAIDEMFTQGKLEFIDKLYG